ncbi:lipopolysaccharide kinase InaA family protein [Epilithonimonas sp.]|uniref:lipopolysaccharide kinase InaA family protein n=1 Tax=Epilithonimonas sp. TaxID=2894511 RepID=UPI00289C5D64|nr:lipopolysaccharide kinase InaA family protein [Epilithonimonas sp.]
MNFILSEAYSQYKNDILRILDNFKTDGVIVGHGNRNTVKFFNVDQLKFNFKSFKQHNFINRHVYKYYRKSKARRSYEYANLLLNKNFYTPTPIAYVEFYDFWGLTSSYYVSEQLDNCFPLTDALHNPEFTDRDTIFKSYASLIYNLHENGIEFIDNASGNFLIKKENETYNFYLVDLNRMNFHTDFPTDKRLRNFARLTDDTETMKIISAEYSKLSGVPVEYCLQKINEASEKMVRKRKIKKILKFYKYFLKK